MRSRVDVGGGIELEVERLGSGPPLLLVMGLGRQLIHWPPALVEALLEVGFEVIRFDNRDAGRSTHLSELGRPPLGRLALGALRGRPGRAPYGLEAMARDMVGLLDRLGLPSAHVLGTSLGGMVAQVFALEHPERTLSLTSLMSNPGLGLRRIGVRALSALVGPPPRDEDDAVARTRQVFARIGSPDLVRDPAVEESLAREAWRRSRDPDGIVRQLAAALVSFDRTSRLARLRCPALVVHGTRDPLMLPRAARDTAAAIPGARLRWVEGMGHELDPRCVPVLREELARLLEGAPATV